MGITLRRGTIDDAETCGRICHRAFTESQLQHGFPPLFSEPDVTISLARNLLTDNAVYSVVAELDGCIVGSNFLHEGAVIAGVGPITTDPTAQSKGIGRLMMEDVLRRADETGVVGVRLTQEAYNIKSFSLYTKLGFSVKEPLAIVNGPPLQRESVGYTVRPAWEDDLESCNVLAKRVHGHDRRTELAAAITLRTAHVVEQHGKITGYLTNLGFRGHAVGETNGDLGALIASADNITGAGFFVPTRNSDLVRWCLENGFEIVSPATLMSIGLYNKPNGVFLPSVTF